GRRIAGVPEGRPRATPAGARDELADVRRLLARRLGLPRPPPRDPEAGHTEPAPPQRHGAASAHGRAAGSAPREVLLRSDGSEGLLGNGEPVRGRALAALGRLQREWLTRRATTPTLGRDPSSARIATCSSGATPRAPSSSRWCWRTGWCCSTPPR